MTVKLFISVHECTVTVSCLNIIILHDNLPYSRKIWRELYLAIWPPNAEIKYWRNLNLVICDCKAKFHCVILACG